MHQNETVISRHGGDSRPEHFGMKQRLEVAVKAAKIASKTLMLEETSQIIIDNL